MTGSPSSPPPAVLSAYGFQRDTIRVLEGGLINQTYVVERQGEPKAVLQRVHTAFAPEVHDDIAAVTAHLAQRGVPTPRLIPTQKGELYTSCDEQRVWRAMTYAHGQTVHKVHDPVFAAEAAALLARCHRAGADLQYEFQSVRADVHDTAAHLRRLRAVAAGSVGAVSMLCDEVLDAAEGLELLGALESLPRRVCHGDPKISNFLFSKTDPPRALYLIDLDTFGYLPIAYELGDALRSWCNPAGEDFEEPTIDTDIFQAALGGYASTGLDLLDEGEWRSIVPGLEAVCVELAARFCVDAVEDRYFGWDSSKYENRREHNLVRARGQLALARSVNAERGHLEALVEARTG